MDTPKKKRTYTPEQKAQQLERARSHRTKNPQAHRDAVRRFRSRNTAKCSDLRKKWRIANLEREKKTFQVWYLKTRYGLSLEQYEALKTRQNHRCAACGDEGQLVIDHCHSTGRVRGLLCQPCNLTLGNAKEDAIRLRALATYTESQSQSQSSAA